jgi:polyhydroxyalkanoate synthesis repressor PhaR
MTSDESCRKNLSKFRRKCDPTFDGMVAFGREVRIVETKPEAGGESGRPRRVIKRYSNRKLYDTKDSRYVTLLQIAEMVRNGEEVQIIDNNSKEDLTEVTLAQIIYEEQKAHSRNVPLQTLKELIHQRTEKVLHELREGPIGRLIPGSRADAQPTAEEERPGFVGQAKEKIEDWQEKVDDRVKAVLSNFMPWQQLQHEVRRLTARIEELEEKLKGTKKEGP